MKRARNCFLPPFEFAPFSDALFPFLRALPLALIPLWPPSPLGATLKAGAGCNGLKNAAEKQEQIHPPRETAFAHVSLGHHAMNAGADRNACFRFFSFPLLPRRHCLDAARGQPPCSVCGCGESAAAHPALAASLNRFSESGLEKKQKEPSPFHARATGRALARPAFCRPPKIARHFTAQAAPPGRHWQPGPALSGGAPFTCFAARAAQAPR